MAATHFFSLKVRSAGVDWSRAKNLSGEALCKKKLITIFSPCRYPPCHVLIRYSGMTGQYLVLNFTAEYL